MSNELEKEAQEKMAQLLWFTDTHHSTVYPTKRHYEIAGQLLKRLLVLGYHKLPKGEPPLLEADLGCSREANMEAQRQSDINWMKGEKDAG